MLPKSTSHQKKRKTFVPFKLGKNDCVYCRRDLGTEVRIRCAVCPEPNSFCIDCFGARVEIGKHKADHDYMVVDTPGVCLLSEDWTADEELRLLEAIEASGYGNWEAAAEHVGNGRTRQACERHYARFYQESSLPGGLPDLDKPLAPGTKDDDVPDPPAPAYASWE